MPSRENPWVRIEIRNAEGHYDGEVITELGDALVINVNGAERTFGGKRLMFDTGAGDTLLVGEPGQPGDTEVFVEDFEGNIFPIYEGTGVLGIAELPERTIPVARAPEFPYFQGTIDALGGNLHGLLGPTAFPGEVLTFDGDDRLMWVD